MNDIEFLKSLADWIDSGAEFLDSLTFTIEMNSDECSDQLRHIAGRLFKEENRMLTQKLEKDRHDINEDYKFLIDIAETADKSEDGLVFVKDTERLRQIATRLQTVEQGYKVVIPDLDEQDKNREAHDRWKDRSE